jgi:hypothetical protein
MHQREGLILIDMSHASLTNFDAVRPISPNATVEGALHYA